MLAARKRQAEEEKMARVAELAARNEAVRVAAAQAEAEAAAQREALRERLDDKASGRCALLCSWRLHAHAFCLLLLAARHEVHLLWSPVLCSCGGDAQPALQGLRHCVFLSVSAVQLTWPCHCHPLRRRAAPRRWRSRGGA